MVTKLIRLTHNSDTTAPSGRGMYHLQFLLQEASLETWIHPHMSPYYILRMSILPLALVFICMTNQYCH